MTSMARRPDDCRRFGAYRDFVGRGGGTGICESFKSSSAKVNGSAHLSGSLHGHGRPKGLAAKQNIDHLIASTGISVVPFDGAAAQAAAGAFIRYGKGRHPASLNFGDCISYALSKTEMLPLLFKGEDFRQTDVKAAL
ncbi:MAG: type II toxin-antitoxin system VapC family toxin [Rhizobiales bacterium]|nr:type II toxin-antitoxin system VapC family toxin [Hyphomicrobiales bacterium]